MSLEDLQSHLQSALDDLRPVGEPLAEVGRALLGDQLRLQGVQLNQTRLLWQSMCEHCET